MHLGKVTPILRIFDEAKALEFYVDFLGFKVDWQHRFEANYPLYLQVSLGECVLHLTEHHGDASPGSAVRIQAQGVDAYQQQLAGKDYRYAKPEVEDTPWGSREMSIKDPFGNRVVFAEEGEG
ncbi:MULTISPECIES: glyoxalase superfamily protein [Pseudomonas]|uniref:Bleomycin resistance protein n=1 Tax=Pseudomonas tritici TaxID=2745518 RepID=A0A8H9Z1E1_9PSED|nr:MULTISPECIES: glyoxalase superfamily protein [Pseudomonas]MBP2875020.1 VOC family protein [Pseudomonas sp. SWRI144]MBW8129140.1 VOC family protein [Pseudomonas sp. LAP_36]MBW8135836.1 VOC family protein [Pseudomonas sp. PAMC 26818]QXH83135.1 VOC family protein [Pseudomonas tritici]CRM20264.1 Glyoxalase-like domain protein [Pseudomonas sp. 24 E 1]